jgi:hypothetical protein
MATQVFRACCKRVVEGREKPFWDDTGLKLLVGEWEGRPSYTIVDGRTGGKYACYLIEKRENSGQSQGGGGYDPAGERQPPAHDDDVPF